KSISATPGPKTIGSKEDTIIIADCKHHAPPESLLISSFFQHPPFLYIYSPANVAPVKSDIMQPFEILLYTAPEGKTHIEVFYEEETFWLSQKKMAELFGVDVRTINEHLNNIFTTNELSKEATIRNFRIVQTEGSRQVSRGVDFYNL